MKLSPSSRRLAVLALAIGLSTIGVTAPDALADDQCSKPSCMTYLEGLHLELSRNPDNADTLMRIARAYQAEGNKRQMLTYLDRYLALRPSDANVMLEAARLALGFPDFPAAEKYLQNALHQGGDPLALHKELGLLYLKMDRPREAIAEYQTVLASNEQDVEAHANLGMALLKADNLGQAITHLHRATELQPNNADRHNILGLAYIQAQRPKKAVESFKKALTVQPGSIVYHYNLGEAYRLLGMSEQSLSEFDNDLQEEPNTSDEWFNRGKVHFRLGLYETSIRTYQTALQKYNDPVSRAQVYLAIGYAYEALDDVPQARQYFQNYLAIVPKGNTADSVRERIKTLQSSSREY